MSLTIEVDLLTGTYEAGMGGDRREWPPHPARVFCALLAQARTDAEKRALLWLERQGPPEVLASEAESSLLRGYVPTNAVSSSRAGSTYLARTNGTRAWPRALPAVPAFRFVWADARAEQDIVGCLRDLAARVPYVGRPAGMVAVRVSTDAQPGTERFRRFLPASEGPHLLRVPYPGYVDALVAAFDSNLPADTVSKSHPYAEPVTRMPAGSVIQRGPYSRLFTLGFPPGSGVAGWHAGRVAIALRNAFLSRLGKPWPDDPWRPFAPEELVAIHGHHSRIPPEGRCAFFSLPFVGSSHATGELIGVGIAIGQAVAPELRRALLRLLGLDRDEGPRLQELRVPGLRSNLSLSVPDGRWSIEPHRWARPSRRWASVTPVVLDRWPKRWADVSTIVEEGIRMAGYPEPEGVEIRRGSAILGAPLFRPEDRKRRPGDPDRFWVHVVVTFSDPVEGPVLLGNLRYAGLGLCAPVADDD